MRDWQQELPPGTLLVGRFDRSYAMVVHVRTEKLPIGWEQLHVLVLTSRGQLVDINLQPKFFYDSWLKVLT